MNKYPCETQQLFKNDKYYFQASKPCMPVTLSEVEMHSFSAKTEILR